MDESLLVLERPRLTNEKFYTRVVKNNNESNLIGFKFTTQFCRILDIVELSTKSKININNLWLASNLSPIFDIDFLIDIRDPKPQETDFPTYQRLYRIFRTFNFLSANKMSIHLRKVGSTSQLSLKDQSNHYKILLMRGNIENRMVVINSSSQNRGFITLADILESLNLKCKDLEQIWLFENFLIDSNKFHYIVDIKSDNYLELEFFGKRRSSFQAIEDINGQEKQAKLSVEVTLSAISKINGKTEENHGNQTKIESSGFGSGFSGKNINQENLQVPPKLENPAISVETSKINANQSKPKNIPENPPEIIAVCLTCGGIVQNHFKCYHCSRVFLENPGMPAQTTVKPVCIKLEMPDRINNN